MPTLRLTLTWPDGATVTATATAAHVNDEAAVAYVGARERLPVIFERCSVSTLRAVFVRAAAVVPGARLDEQLAGLWRDEKDVAPRAKNAPQLGLRVVERLEDFTLEHLAVVDGPGGPELHGWFDGVECLLDAKPSMLAAGYAACIPMAPDLAVDWPMTLRLEIDGNTPELIHNVTAEPRAVAALRHLTRALEEGRACAGMEIEG